jgi:nicotinamidase-related amidase
MGWLFRNPRTQQKRRTNGSHEYLKKLAEGKRYPHRVWPPHCLLGTPGHEIVAPIMQAVLGWCERELATFCLHTTSSNVFVEHFSAVKAEVPDPEDPATQLNTDLIDMLMDADEILVAGEPGSHMLTNSRVAGDVHALA